MSRPPISLSMLLKILCLALFNVALSTSVQSAGLDRSVSSGMQHKIMDLSKALLKSRAVDRHKEQAQLAKDKTEIRELQKELSQDIVEPGGEWVRVVDISQGKHAAGFKQDQSDKIRQLQDKTASVHSRISTGSAPPGLNGHEKAAWETKRNAKLSVLENISNQLGKGGGNASLQNLKQHGEYLNSLEIRPAGARANHGDGGPVLQPTNRIQLKYSIEEFRAMQQ